METASFTYTHHLNAATQRMSYKGHSRVYCQAVGGLSVYRRAGGHRLDIGVGALEQIPSKRNR